MYFFEFLHKFFMTFQKVLFCSTMTVEQAPTTVSWGGAGVLAAVSLGTACTAARSVSSDVEEMSINSGPDSASKKFAMV